MSDEKPGKVDLGKSSAKTTQKGPHGGGNKYHQTAVANGFMTHDARPGHSQKKNVKNPNEK